MNFPPFCNMCQVEHSAGADAALASTAWRKTGHVFPTVHMCHLRPQGHESRMKSKGWNVTAGPQTPKTPHLLVLTANAKSTLRYVVLDHGTLYFKPQTADCEFAS